VITVTLDRRTERALRGTLRTLTERLAPRALATALNRTAADARRATVRQVAREKQLPQKHLRRRVRTRRATARRPATAVWFGVRSIKLADVSGAAPTQTRRGARVGRRAVAGGFVAKMPSGHVGVFTRRQPSQRVGPGARDRPRARRALPVDEAVIRLLPEGETILRREARQAMRERMPVHLRRALRRRPRPRR